MEMANISNETRRVQKVKMFTAGAQAPRPSDYHEELRFRFFDFLREEPTFRRCEWLRPLRPERLAGLCRSPSFFSHADQYRDKPPPLCYFPDKRKAMKPAARQAIKTHSTAQPCNHLFLFSSIGSPDRVLFSSS